MNVENKTKSEWQGTRTLGAIDIGTSSIRLVIGQVSAEGQWETLERLQRSVRLGQDTFRRGRLRTPTIRSAVAILRDYRDLLDTYNVDEIRAVATSAVREATNGDTFLDRVLMATDIDVSPISVAEESRLTIAAVRQAATDQLKQRKNALIVQVGGGSTVLIVLSQGKVVTCQSLPIGSIRFQETLATQTEDPAEAAKLIHHQVTSTLSAFTHLLPLKRVQTFMALGAEARWCAGTLSKTPDQLNMTTFTRKTFDGLVTKCQRHTPDKLTKKLGLSFVDAETLIPSLLIHQGLLHATRAQKIIVPGVSMVDGLLQEMIRAGHETQDDAFTQQVLDSARAIAEQYGCHTAHVTQVMELATTLFDTMVRDHRLDAHNRLLLQVAALLHEIGTFVSSRSHHKHTLYLAAHSEIFGLTQEELLIVANVARYHRRNRPRPTHVAYMSLSREKRILVNKLGALLRVADALDISRTHQCKIIEIQRDEENLIIVPQGGGDFTLEKRSLRSNSDMFQDIYGLDVRIEENAHPLTKD